MQYKKHLANVHLSNNDTKNQIFRNGIIIITIYNNLFAEVLLRYLTHCHDNFYQNFYKCVVPPH